MNTNEGSTVKQFGNDVEGCKSEKVLVQANMCVFPQYSVNLMENNRFVCECILASVSFWPYLIIDSVARVSQHVLFTHDLLVK